MVTELHGNGITVTIYMMGYELDFFILLSSGVMPQNVWGRGAQPLRWSGVSDWEGGGVWGEGDGTLTTGG